MKLEFQLPSWISALAGRHRKPMEHVEERMALAIEFARQNVARGTGGPFGAAVFDDAGRLVAPGVNLVVGSGCSMLHAEMVAMALAQKRIGRFDLSDGGKRSYELVTSTEPCAMCFGAIPWSGISRLVCGARDSDARSIGFDEGPKLRTWVRALESRGIRVVRDVGRAGAVEVLQEYAETGGIVYNASRGK